MGKKVHFLLVLSVSVAVISISVLFMNTAVARPNPPSGPPQSAPTADSLSEKQVSEIKKIIEDYLDTSGLASLNGHLQFQLDKTLDTVKESTKRADESINRANAQLTWIQFFMLAIIGIVGFLIRYGKQWMIQTVNTLIETKGNEKAEKFFQEMNKQGNEMFDNRIKQESIYSQLLKRLEIVPLSSMHVLTDEEKKPIEDQLNEIEKYRDKNYNLVQTVYGFYIQGDAYYFIKKYDEAIRCYEQALEMPDGKKDFEVLCKKGNALAGKGKYHQAIGLYEEALDIRPNYFEALHSWGDALQGLGKHDDAIKYYNKALVIKPENLETWYQMGNALTALGHYKDAIDCYDRVLSNNKFHSWAWHSLGDAYYAWGDFEEADKAYQTALDKINIRNGKTWYKRANVKADHEQWQDAVEYYNKAVEYGCDSKNLYAKLGYALKKSGQSCETVIDELYKKAIDGHNQALRSGDSPDYSACGTYYGLAVCYAMQENKKDLALQYLRCAIECNPIVKVWAKAAYYADFKLIKDDKDFQELARHQFSIDG
jgi:tetratricopeptide (TPR) repeat protein